MKTPDDIKKGLQHCKGANPCADCTYDRRDFPQCIIRLQSDALSLIRQLEAGLAQWEDVSASPGAVEDIARENYRLTQELEAVNRERDAAVKILFEHGECDGCKHLPKGAEEEPCISCNRSWMYEEDDNWEWQGVCPENMEVSTDA